MGEDKKSASETGPDQGTRLTLYRGWLDRGKHVWSPFSVKLEARLRFAGVSYATDAGSPFKAPKGKIPYIEYQGIPPSGCVDESQLLPTTLGDSTLIIKHLIERDVLPDINAKLSSTAKAQDLALRALLEEKLYFYHVRASSSPRFRPPLLQVYMESTC